MFCAQLRSGRRCRRCTRALRSAAIWRSRSAVAMLFTAATEIGGGELRVGHDTHVDRRRRARGSSDRCESRSASGRAAYTSPYWLPMFEPNDRLCPGKLHVAQHRAEIERVLRRERLRPHAELAAAGRPADPATRPARALRSRRWHIAISSPTESNGFLASISICATFSISLSSARIFIGTSNSDWSMMSAVAGVPQDRCRESRRRPGRRAASTRTSARAASLRECALADSASQHHFVSGCTIVS